MDPISITFTYKDNTEETVTVPWGSTSMPVDLVGPGEGLGKPVKYRSDSPLTKELFLHIGNKVMMRGYVLNRSGLRD